MVYILSSFLKTCSNYISDRDIRLKRGTEIYKEPPEPQLDWQVANAIFLPCPSFQPPNLPFPKASKQW